MVSPRTAELARLRERRRRSHDRAARLIALAFVAAALIVTLALTAFGSGNPRRLVTTPASASRLLPAGPPRPQIVATVGALRIQLPVAQSAVTAIGYHGSGSGTLALAPLGRQGNEGLLARLWHTISGSKQGGLTWYQLGGGSGPGTSALDVGARPGTDVYAPVGGTIVGISDYVVSNRTYGARIDIRPTAAPSVLVSLTQLRPDPSLTVGSTVEAASSKIGVVVDVSAVERQALARYTQDAGTNVTLEVRPAATLSAR
jgi:hypothetical protein